MMNKSLLIGRLTAAPELKITATNKTVLRCTIAVNRQFKTAEGKREADFITLVIWGKSAELFQSYVHKGSLISVEGELRSRRYEDKHDVTHYMTEVLCHQFNLLESKAAVALREGNDNSFLDDDSAVEALPF